MNLVELRFLASGPGQKTRHACNVAKYTGRIIKDADGNTIGEKIWLGEATYEKGRVYKFTDEWATRMLEIGGWERVEQEKLKPRPGRQKKDVKEAHNGN